MTDDPLDRLASEEDWSQKARSVEDELAKQRRRNFMRRPRGPRPRGPRTRGPRTGGPRMRAPAISMIFIGLVVTTLVSGWLLWAEVTPAPVTTFVFVLSAWLITLCLHEFGHALMAHRRGDYTVADKGYLTLDIRRYGHPLLTFVLPVLFLIIGGLPLPGGAVMIERHRLRGRFGSAMVSAAGPAVNVVAAVLLLAIVSLFGPELIFALSEPHDEFWAALTFLAYLQVATAILNLIPIPGIDGYGIIEPFLDPSTRNTGEKIKPYGLILLFLLLILPPVRTGFSWLTDSIVDGSGAPAFGTAYGYALFQFYRFW
ncbi:MAG TPA: site-2 protease family protein [Candidatus Limnocylindrales bacterium]|nr:site-2 protease family protein [Candidatus Limnocylindrales bacterium]